MDTPFVLSRRCCCCWLSFICFAFWLFIKHAREVSAPRCAIFSSPNCLVSSSARLWWHWRRRSNKLLHSSDASSVVVLLLPLVVIALSSSGAGSGGGGDEAQKKDQIKTFWKKFIAAAINWRKKIPFNRPPAACPWLQSTSTSSLGRKKVSSWLRSATESYEKSRLIEISRVVILFQFNVQLSTLLLSLQLAQKVPIHSRVTLIRSEGYNLVADR